MAKLTLTDISAGYLSVATYNANNTLIETALENTLSRDGTTPNTMSANLDLNSNKIVNVTDGTNAQDAVTKSQLDAVVAGTGYVEASQDATITGDWTFQDQLTIGADATNKWDLQANAGGWLSVTAGSAATGVYLYGAQDFGIYATETGVIADPPAQGNDYLVNYTIYDSNDNVIGIMGFSDSTQSVLSLGNEVRSGPMQFYTYDSAGAEVNWCFFDPDTGTDGLLSLGNYDIDVFQTVGAGQDGYVLTYDNGTGLVSLEAAPGAGGVTQLSDLSDVNTSTATNRNVLVADGVDFESRALVEADISDLGTYETADAAIAKTDEDEVITGAWNVPSTINTQNGNYTLVLGDAGKTIRKASGGAGETITIPANASVAIPVGTFVAFDNEGGGDLTIAITTDTLIFADDGTTGSRTLADSGYAVAQKVATTTWKIAGSQLT